MRGVDGVDGPNDGGHFRGGHRAFLLGAHPPDDERQGQRVGRAVDERRRRAEVGLAVGGGGGVDLQEAGTFVRAEAGRAGRITLEWMSPRDARASFGIPSFDGRRGLLLTFGGQVTTSGAQLIGPADLREGRLDSISGIYRFTDRDGQTRAYIAIRDEACARIRAADLQERGSPRRARPSSAARSTRPRS